MLKLQSFSVDIIHRQTYCFFRFKKKQQKTNLQLPSTVAFASRILKHTVAYHE